MLFLVNLLAFGTLHGEILNFINFPYKKPKKTFVSLLWLIVI